MARPETGTMQFGEDWTGVFVRGDEAHHFAHTLREIMTENPRDFDRMQRGVLERMADLMESCENVDGDQRLKPFEECKRG